MKRLVFFLLICCALNASPVWANKARVESEAPDTVQAGQQILVRLHVYHNANNFMHFPERVSFRIGERKIEPWNYDLVRRPPGANFTIEYPLILTETTTLSASAECDSHGSAGVFTKTVPVK